MHSRFLRAASYHGIGPCKQHMHCSHSYSSHTYSSGITEYLSDLQPPKTAKQTTMHSRSLRAASCFETGPCKQHKQCSLSYSSHNYLSRYSCAPVRSATTQDIRARNYAFHVPVSSIFSWDNPCKQQSHCSHSYSSQVIRLGIAERLSDLQPPKTRRQKNYAACHGTASCHGTNRCKQHRLWYCARGKGSVECLKNRNASNY